MPKHKTRKSVSSRFKLTKTGKLLFRSQMGRHRKRKKSKSQQRRVKVLKEMTGAMKSKIKKML
ncbi:50S ribosomal protein L35 [Candidatus Roizmanbacteria bacterium]|nr:50S ribosomal protein L35 [Candidatus Roizmanbacteria bacterium]